MRLLAVTPLHGKPVTWPRPPDLLGVAGVICDLAAGLTRRGHQVSVLDVFPDNPQTYYRRRLDLLLGCDAVIVYGYSTRSPLVDRAHNGQVIEWVRESSDAPVLEFVHSWRARETAFPGVTSAVFTRHEYQSSPKELRDSGAIVHLPHAIRHEVLGGADGPHRPNLLGYVGTLQEALWLEPVNRQAGLEMGLPEPREVAAALARHDPSLRWRFCGPRDREDELDPELRELAEVRGPVPFARIGDAYREFGAYLYTNAIDSFGMTIPEAQWCGCPVICFDTEHYREVAGEGALFCRVVQDFVDAVDALQDPDTRETVRLAGRRNARRFLLRRVARTCEAHLNRLVHGHESPSAWRSLLSLLPLGARTR
jgi:glycosyltransferase involved in cell wall biosynthesis